MPTVKEYWGMTCPICKTDEDLRVIVTASMRLTGDGTEDMDCPTEWDNDSRMSCGSCEHVGVVGDFKNLQCDGRKDCPDIVTHIDEKGFIYCAKHGVDRRGYPGGIYNRRCRKLRPHEVRRLQRGDVLKGY